jgi:hypothetical protein
VTRLIIPLVSIAATVAMLTVPSASATGTRTLAAASTEPFCEAHTGVCPDTFRHTNYEGQYVGHDEPAVLFYSTQAGAGNSNQWRLRLPHESPVLPKQDGTGGTWNFQQHVAFWFGMALCESESYPNPGVPCTANSDANIRDNPDPSAPDYRRRSHPIRRRFSS